MMALEAYSSSTRTQFFRLGTGIGLEPSGVFGREFGKSEASLSI
jgi:hypothetical protein